MTNPPNQSLVPTGTGSTKIDILKFEESLLEVIEYLGLPSVSVFVPGHERQDVFRNIESVVQIIPTGSRQNSIYISKFLAATGAGLFDAALNYLWDQTILELRQRVAKYDLAYFFDIAVKDQTKRKKLSTEVDLEKIDDHELITGALEIELISEIGFKHLDFIRYMRNRASAAHPNQNDITGLQLIAWLQTCITQVINLPPSTVALEIGRLLKNIKSNRISPTDARQVAVFFTNLTKDQVNSLCSGFFGIYTDLSTSVQTRQNILLLLPHLWDRVDEPIRYQFGMKYAQFLARNEQQQQGLARQFLEAVSAFSYVPDDIRAAEIEDAISNLLVTHRNFNNFHNEPVFARQLQRLVGDSGRIPEQIVQTYVLCVVEVFLTNGNGIAWNAEPIYIQLLEQFDPRQSLIAAVSFRNQTIASKLQFTLCQQKYDELLKMMINQVASPAVKELIEDIDSIMSKTRSPETLRKDPALNQKIENLRQILNV